MNDERAALVAEIIASVRRMQDVELLRRIVLYIDRITGGRRHE